jgi:ribosomal protein S18 acetylase RimI-like enzyme
MTPTLYFLRSSESKIVKDMTKYAHKKSDNLNIYYDFYGLTAKDLGLYALVDGIIAGAIWSRKFDGETPILSLAVLPEFRAKGLATAMMEQFLVEAGAVSQEMQVQTYADERAVNFYEKFDFIKLSKGVMSKTFERQEIVRPTDGYDPRRWMD